MPKENPKSRDVSGSKLNKDAYIAMIALEDYGYTGSYTLTSMHRSTEVNASSGGKENSLHLDGNAIDIGKKASDDKELAEWIKTEAGKKWMKDFNVYHEDEGDHHHFGFRGTEDTSSITNYDKYEKVYNSNKNEDDEFVEVDLNDIDNKLSWAVVSSNISNEDDVDLDEVYVIDYDSGEPIKIDGKNVDANSEEGQDLIDNGTGYSETKSQYEARSENDTGVTEDREDKIEKPERPNRRDFRTTPEFRKAEREYYKKLDEWKKSQEQEQESDELKPEDIVTDEEDSSEETIQLAIGKGDKGHLSNDKQNKLEELGIELQIRTDDKGFTFYEIKADNKEDADKIMSQLDDAGFENQYIVGRSGNEKKVEKQVEEADRRAVITDRTIQLAIEKDGRGGLTEAQEKKIEDMGLVLNKRTDDKGFTFYEIKADTVEDSKKIMKALDDAGFKEHFVVGAKISHNLQLAIEKDGRGGLTNEQENKLEELGITLNKRTDDKGITYYEVEAKDLNEANKIIKKLEDNNFEDVFIKHTKTNTDGSTVQLSDKELFEQTGQITQKYREEKLKEDAEFWATEHEKYGYDKATWDQLRPEQQQVVREQHQINLTSEEQVVEEESGIVLREEYNRVTNTDGTITVTYTDGTTEILPAPTKETSNEEVVEEPVSTDVDGGEKKTILEKVRGVAGAAFEGAGQVLDAVGGPSAIISYIMGKKGLEAAMKEVEPHKLPELSPLFHEQLRQSKELAKKGFHPNEERAIRKEIDNAFKIGLENSVRGTAGDRAKFLAQSGLLDSKRSSALLALSVKDAELQRENQDKYVETMMFKENFDAQRSEKLRAEDMQKQLMDKQAGAQFASAAFSNIMSNIGGGNSALIKQMLQEFTNGRGANIHNPIE